MTPKEMNEEAKKLMLRGYHCSQAVMAAGLKKLNLPDEHLVKSLAPMGGGIASTGGACGAFTGGVICVGRLFGRDKPETSDDRAMWKASNEYYRRFREEVSLRRDSVMCAEIAGVDWRNREQAHAYYNGAGRERCAAMTGKAAEILGEILEKYMQE